MFRDLILRYGILCDGVNLKSTAATKYLEVVDKDLYSLTSLGDT